MSFDASQDVCLFQSFQARVQKWVRHCFGDQIASDKAERNRRFLEESVELVQSLGMTQAEVFAIVNYVFERPEGESFQEVGGVTVTLASLCEANQIPMGLAGETELERCWGKTERIREKQKAKVEQGVA